jgi:hypothetical protein
MNNLRIVDGPLTKARADLRDATEAMTTYWSRGLSDGDGQMTDVRAVLAKVFSAEDEIDLRHYSPRFLREAVQR